MKNNLQWFMEVPGVLAENKKWEKNTFSMKCQPTNSMKIIQKQTYFGERLVDKW